MRAGLVTCPYCGEKIEPEQRWHLGHSDDRASYVGPLHALCNLREAGHKAARVFHGHTTVTSQEW